MKPLLSMLMIPLLLVGNSLAHLHGSSAYGVTDQALGHARPHFHIGMGIHHHHHHPTHVNALNRHSYQAAHVSRGHAKHFESVVEVPSEHDSDAIYLVHADFTNTSTNHNGFELAVDYQLEAATSYSPLAQRAARPDWRTSAISSGLPLYLRWAVLRL